MKIAFVSQPWNRVVPPVEIGSVAILTYEAARRLAAEHDVTIYAKQDPGDKALEEREGVRYKRFPIQWDARLLAQLGRFNRFRSPKRPLFASRLFFFGYITRVALDMRREKCDVVQLFNFSQFAPIVHAMEPDAKVVLRMSCEWLTQLDSSVVKSYLRRVDAVFGCSEFITSGIRSAFPEYAERCCTILNGRDVDYFASASGEPAGAIGGSKRVLYVGRLSPEKGIHVLVRAFKKVLEVHPEARLDIIGPTGSTPTSFVLDLTDDPMVRALAPMFGQNYEAYLRSEIGPELSGKIVLRGAVAHRGLVEEYRTAKLLVFPSIWNEPSGNPPIEAMAAGIPVVSTRTGGTREYVEDGRTGLLVPPNESDALAGAIIRLLGDEGLRTRMGEAGRERAVALFSYDRFAKDLVAMYQRILGE